MLTLRLGMGFSLLYFVFTFSGKSTSERVKNKDPSGVLLQKRIEGIARK